MRPQRTKEERPSGDRLVPVGLGLLAAYQLTLGFFMVVAPGAFFELVGPFGARNDHYTRDNATFTLALGVVALVAVRRPSWRLPTLAFAVVQFALHTANHLADIGAASPGWLGPADFVALLVATILLAVLLGAAARRTEAHRR